LIESIAPILTAVRKAGPSIYLAALIASALLLFLPDFVLATIGLAQFLDTYRMYVGVIFIASASLIAVWIISSAGAPLLDKLETWRLNRQGLKTLRELTDDEKKFLRPYIQSGQNTQYAQLADGIARGLQAKGIIYRASQISIPGGDFPFNLQPYMRRLLKEHGYLLD
jgi:hypothetical protein